MPPIAPRGRKKITCRTALLYAQPSRIDRLVALDAFEGGGFFLLFDDRQVESLDDELGLTERSVAGFVQLLPLVGG